MDFLFRQGKNGDSDLCSVLNASGIEGFLLKRISFEKDRRSITRKSHYHTSFEIHFIEKGYQIYECDGRRLRVNQGEFLMIAPFVKHVVVSEAPDTLKYAFSFTLKEGGAMGISVNACSYATDATPIEIQRGLEFISAEVERKAPYYSTLIENRIFECVTHLFRTINAIDAPSVCYAEEDDDPRVHLIKQYIEDNIYRAITMSELASYCCLSEKQLERVFRQQAGCTVMDFVRKSKCKQIERLLADPSLSLKSISEIMDFSSEYYFNAFFKKYAGMTPGAYRKTFSKQ